MSDEWAAFRSAPDEWASFRAPQAPAAPASSSLGMAGQFGAGFNRRLTDVAGALPGLYDQGLQAVGLPRLFGNETQTASERMLGGMNSVVGTPPEAQGAGERLARGAGSGLVDAASVLVPATMLARGSAAVGAQAPSLLNRAAAALSAQPGAQIAAGMVGGGVGDATENPLLGAAAAFATPLALGAAGRAISPIRNANTPARQALLSTAEREGIPVTAGQATGSRFLQNVESQLEQLPLTSAPQRAIRDEQQRAFSRAVMLRAGENVDNAGPEALNAARTRMGAVFDDLSNRNVLQVTPALEGRLAQVEDSLRFIPTEAGAPIRARIEQLRGMMIQPPANPSGTALPPGQAPLNPTIPGASYRMMDSALGRGIRSTSNGDLRGALGDLRTTLRGAMDASISPDDAAAWGQVRREYANYKTVERAMGGAGGAVAEGAVSPLALRGAVNTGTAGGYASGRGDLNELARLGQGVLRAPPDSGTAGRTMASNLLTGGTVATGGGMGAMVGGPVGAAVGAAGSLVAPRLIQMLMNSGPGQSYLRNQVVQNPQITRSLLAALLAQQAGGAQVRSRP